MRRSRLLVFGFSTGALLLLASPVVVDLLRVRSLQNRADLVRVGDTRERVTSILGRPNVLFPRGSGLLDGIIVGVFPVTPERWAYGSWFDWEDCFSRHFPYLNPIRMRLFGPAPDDLSVVFDVNGKVLRVEKPPE